MRNQTNQQMAAIETTQSKPANALQRLLALDTSTSTLSVALLEGSQLLAAKHEYGERNHSTRLMPVVDALLAEQGLSMDELDGIAAGVGPGSYTGIRIGVTVAKTIAWTLDLPLFGISSLHALALSYGMHSSKGLTGESMANSSRSPELNAGHASTWYIPLMDARRGQVYTALFAEPAVMNKQRVGEPLELQAELRAIDFARLAPDGLQMLADWLNELRLLLNGAAEQDKPATIYFVGEVQPFIEPLSRFQEELAQHVQVRMEEIEMNAHVTGLLAQARWCRGEREDVHSFVPNYTQLAEAEVKLRARMQAEKLEQGSAASSTGAKLQGDRQDESMASCSTSSSHDPMKQDQAKHGDGYEAQSKG